METLPPTSRLSAHVPSLSFGELSNLLRSELADEDSRQLSEDMQHLALQAEGVAAGLRLDRRREYAAPLLMDMLNVLRDHRTLVVNLGLDWRGLYEYAGYLQALNNFRVLIGQWLLDVDPWGSGELHVTPEEFTLVAWRTLGEGTLLVDVHEQWLAREEAAGSDFGALTEPQKERALQWWQKLRR
ncbi:hypothetical protein H8N03_23955 [Ramlibacter sp. USB13]|uniref:Uncharacterized protein n=1 Tax=Ramlibacter cellulosilyticus TaxID=2764187 RepID=A0A923MWK9_9BURK|nr:hypothetical protein [Ramlibacter cellulosilyticus]MBC5786014.1 hypothetical protein [Ramlibacter cellulosilyticus]